jgi:hypothetical protein
MARFHGVVILLNVSHHENKYSKDRNLAFEGEESITRTSLLAFEVAETTHENLCIYYSEQMCQLSRLPPIGARLR